MAQTLSSSTTLLCSAAEFLKRVDRTAVARLASNTARPVDEGSLETDANVIAALRDACGIFESATAVGGRYSQEDIAVIVAATSSNAYGMLCRIISDIAWANLFERRPNKDVPAPPSLERSMAWLDMLADGKRIFPFTQTMEAGRIEKMDAEVSDVEERNGSVYQARAFYGRRSDQVEGT